MVGKKVVVGGGRLWGKDIDGKSMLPAIMFGSLRPD